MRIVTIKLPRNKEHDPHNKVTAPCVTSGTCTDATGEHHSILVTNQAHLERLKREFHITRIEEV